MTKSKNNFSLGGAAIASGGFGCVFLPPLKCKGSVRPIGKVVSKLLTTDNAETEFNEAKEIQSILQKNIGMDTYARYFIFPEKMCEPDSLTKDDLINFENKCKNLTKIGITSNTLNTTLDSIRIIEMVNGGSDLSHAIKLNKTIPELEKMNNGIIGLLTDAIVPMNKLGILHFDLKSANILIDDSSQLRIIDWGLSVISKNNRIPSGSTSRPIQFNLPFSTVLFNKKIMNHINLELKKISFDNNYKQTIKPHLSPIIHKIVVKYFSKSERGHINYVSTSIKELFEIPNEKNFFLYNLLSSYLTEAVVNFINPITKTFDDLKYFNEVCMRNCDIWGLMTVYYDILMHYETIFVKKPVVLKQLRLLVIRYLYSPEFAGKPIDIDNLVNELKNITSFPYSVKKTNNSKSATNALRDKSTSVIDLISANTAIPLPTTVIPLVSKQKNKDKSTNGVIDLISANTAIPLVAKQTTKKARCKNGTRRNKKTGNCESISKIQQPNPSTQMVSVVAVESVVKKPKVTIGEINKQQKCKNGTRRNTKTNECDTISGTLEIPEEDIVVPKQNLVESKQDVAEPVSLFARLGF